MLKDILGIDCGMTVVIGSGGKTSLIRRLAEEITGKGSTAVVCTTTHIMRPDDMPVFETDGSENASPICIPDTTTDNSVNTKKSVNTDNSVSIEGKLKKFISSNHGRPVCVGVTDPQNTEKLVSFPIDIIRRAAGANSYILVEADGAKHMPLKAHNDREPVIPGGCERVILVIGAEGFEKPILEAVHRPEIFAELAKVSTDTIVTPKLLAGVLSAERKKFGSGRLQIFVNITDMQGNNNLTDKPAKMTDDMDYMKSQGFHETIIKARQIAELTGWEVYAGCAKKGIAVRC